ncbi:MAG: sugar phosphate isomerase/epimerase family protein [Acidobacteriaceae bacterium]
MRKSVSTHVFLRQRLHPGMLDAMLGAGAQGIEIFAARHHFDYHDRLQVREIANWFRSNPVEFNSIHQPLYFETEWGRSTGPSVNIIAPQKPQRVEAMDEVKRAIEVAEMIPLRSAVLHLGNREDAWDTRALENSLTAIEHLKAFASPLGVALHIENIPNEVTEPEHILEVLRVGHFDTVGVCMDVGHANFSQGVAAAFAILKDRIRSLHLHDNLGEKDEHLWPGSGSIDWNWLMREVAALKSPITGVLEIAHTPEESTAAVAQKAVAAFALLEKSSEPEAER